MAILAGFAVPKTSVYFTLLRRPQREHYQHPQDAVVVAAAGIVLVDHRAHPLRRHDAEREKSLAQQMVVEEVAHGAAHPQFKRHTKALLGTIEELGREAVAQGANQDVF